MPISAARFEALRKQVEQGKRDADRAQGALAQVMQEIKAEFGCKTLEEAEKLYKKMEKELARDEAELQKKVEELEGKYDERLE